MAGNDGAAILLCEVGEQDGIVRLAAPQQYADDQGNAERQRSSGSELLALRQIADVLLHLGKG